MSKEVKGYFGGVENVRPGSSGVLSILDSLLEQIEDDGAIQKILRIKDNVAELEEVFFLLRQRDAEERLLLGEELHGITADLQDSISIGRRMEEELVFADKILDKNLGIHFKDMEVSKKLHQLFLFFQSSVVSLRLLPRYLDFLRKKAFPDISVSFVCQADVFGMPDEIKRIPTDYFDELQKGERFDEGGLICKTRFLPPHLLEPTKKVTKKERQEGSCVSLPLLSPDGKIFAFLTFDHKDKDYYNKKIDIQFLRQFADLMAGDIVNKSNFMREREETRQKFRDFDENVSQALELKDSQIKRVGIASSAVTRTLAQHREGWLPQDLEKMVAEVVREIVGLSELEEKLGEDGISRLLSEITKLKKEIEGRLCKNSEVRPCRVTNYGWMGKGKPWQVFRGESIGERKKRLDEMRLKRKLRICQDRARHPQTRKDVDAVLADPPVINDRGVSLDNQELDYERILQARKNRRKNPGKGRLPPKAKHGNKKEEKPLWGFRYTGDDKDGEEPRVTVKYVKKWN